jgi:HEAT repeat protein
MESIFRTISNNYQLKAVAIALLCTALNVTASVSQDKSTGVSRSVAPKVPKQLLRTPVPDIDLHGLEGIDFDLDRIPMAMDEAAKALDRARSGFELPSIASIADMDMVRMAPVAQELASLAGMESFSTITAPLALGQTAYAMEEMKAQLADVSSSMSRCAFYGQDAPSPQDQAAQSAYQKAYNLVLDKRWADAQKELDTFLNKYPRGSYSTAARYWKCYAREKLGDPAEEVFKSYQDFVNKYSSSNWADDARTNMVRIGSELAKQGKTEYGTIVQSMQENEDEDVKLTALYALRNSSDDQALPVIINLYDKSKSEKLRGKIVYVLGGFDSPLVIPKLADIALKDPSTTVRKNAVYALGNTRKSEAAGALKQIVKSQADPDVRTAALYSLSGIGDADMIPFLVEIAKGDNDEKLAKAATYSIANINDVEATKALQTVLKEAKSSAARKAALNSLGNRPDAEAVAILKDVALNTANEEDMRRTAAYALGNIHTSASLEALKSIIASSTDTRSKEAALHAIGTQGGSKVQEFLKNYALTEQDEQLARTAIYALANSHEGDDMQFYVEILRSAKSLEVRKAALYQLGNAQNAGAVKTVGQIAKDEKDDDLKVAAIYVLGNLHSDEAVGILFDIAQKDGNKRARTAAVSALSNIGSKKAQDALVQILEGKTKDQ